MAPIYSKHFSIYSSPLTLRQRTYFLRLTQHFSSVFHNSSTVIPKWALLYSAKTPQLRNKVITWTRSTHILCTLTVPYPRIMETARGTYKLSWVKSWKKKKKKFCLKKTLGSLVPPIPSTRRINNKRGKLTHCWSCHGDLLLAAKHKYINYLAPAPFFCAFFAPHPSSSF